MIVNQEAYGLDKYWESGKIGLSIIIHSPNLMKLLNREFIVSGNLIIAVMAIIIVIAAGTGFYLYEQNQQDGLKRKIDELRLNRDREIQNNNAIRNNNSLLQNADIQKPPLAPSGQTEINNGQPTGETQAKTGATTGSAKCGDGVCDSVEKSKGVCPKDCSSSANSSASTPTQNTTSGQTTTGKLCGDGTCDSMEKANPDLCPEDCK